MQRSSLAGACGPARLQTGATFNYLLVNCPPDTCTNKAAVRGAGAASLPRGCHRGVPPHPTGSGRAGAARGGPGCWGRRRMRMRIRPSRCGRSPGHKGLFLRALTGTFFKGLEVITLCFLLSEGRYVFLSLSPPPPPLFPPAFAMGPPDPVPPFPFR